MGDGGIGDLVKVIIFSQTSGVRSFFPPTYNDVRLFSALYVMSNIFSVQDIVFDRNFFAGFFSSRNQPAGYFFLKSPLIPSKVK